RTTLRPEARAVDYELLDQRQQEAFTHIMGMIDEAVRSLTHRRSDVTSPNSPQLDSERSSRAMLIHGRRGTGKTTLLLSLLKALAAPTDDHSVGRKVVLLETLDM